MLQGIVRAIRYATRLPARSPLRHGDRYSLPFRVSARNTAIFTAANVLLVAPATCVGKWNSS